MKTLHLSIIVILVIIISGTIKEAYSYGSDGGYLMTSPPLAVFFTVTTNLENYTTIDKIMITVHVPNPDNNTSLAIKILGPDNNLKDLHTFSPDPNQVGYTWTVIPNGPLFYNSGNYTVLAQYGQDHAVTSFYLYSTQGDIRIALPSSPLQQFKSGIAAKDVTCEVDLHLVIKAEDGSPACVRPETAQKLVERGWGSLIGVISTVKITSGNDCGQFYTAPENQHNSNTVPVLLMNSNSTACARLTFTVVSNYKDCNGRTCQEVLRLNSTLSIGNFHYEKHVDLISVAPGKDYTNSFQISVVPQTVDLANYPIGSNYTVTYIIKPLPNATGFYDYSIPRLSCGVSPYPLAVGHTADQVNYLDFSYIDQQIHSCYAGEPNILTAVEISDMSYKEVSLP